MSAILLERRSALDRSERAELIWSNGLEDLDRLGLAQTVRDGPYAETARIWEHGEDKRPAFVNSLSLRGTNNSLVRAPA